MHKHTLLHIPSLSSILEITLFIYGVCYIFSVFRVLAAVGGKKIGCKGNKVHEIKSNLLLE